MKKRICASLLCFVLGISLVGCTIPGLGSKKVTGNVDVDVDVDDDDDDDIDIDIDDDVDIDVDDDDDDVDPEPPAPTYKGYYDGQPEALSGEISDFQMQIDGDIMQFPLAVTDIYDLGYEFVETTDIETYRLPGQHYTWGDFRKGKNEEYQFYINNESIHTQVLKDCFISGVKISDYDGDVFNNIVLAGDVTASDLNTDNIMTLFGTPNDYDEGDKYTYVTFEVGSYEYIKFTFNVENEPLLIGIEVKNFVVPEDYDIGEVDETVPEIISTYELPAALSDNYLDFTAEIDGVVYELPCPLSVLIENGFSYDASRSSKFAPGYASATIYLTKGDLKCFCTVYNYYANATAVENCYVTEIEITQRSKVSIKTCFNVNFGDSYDTVIAALDGYDYSESGTTYKSITIVDPDNPYSTEYKFSFDDKGKLNSITVENEPDRKEYIADRGFEY